MNRQKATELVQGQKKQPKKKEMIFVSTDKANFKEVVPGASKAVLWGAMTRGHTARLLGLCRGSTWCP